MRLGIDLDGVVCDFNAGWMELHKAEFGSALVPEMVVSWDNLHELGGFQDMNAFWRWARGTADRPSIFRHLQPFPHAVETLHRLRAAGHRVVIVTAKPRWAIADTLRWVADHDLPTEEIHIRYRKHTVQCDVYLDDSPLVLPELLSYRPDAVICRMIRPWNVPVAGAIDIADWTEFGEFVDRLGDGGRDAGTMTGWQPMTGRH
jgi:5'(3')-deoxyribonucleotidase